MKARCETSHLSGNLDLLALNLNELAPSVDSRVSIFLKHADSIVCFDFFDHLSYVVSLLLTQTK